MFLISTFALSPWPMQAVVGMVLETRACAMNRRGFSVQGCGVDAKKRYLLEGRGFGNRGGLHFGAGVVLHVSGSI